VVNEKEKKKIKEKWKIGEKTTLMSMLVSGWREVGGERLLK
jgi:uncharacterized membrane protein YsdA (DUF1294 family)